MTDTTNVTRIKKLELILLGNKAIHSKSYGLTDDEEFSILLCTIAQRIFEQKIPNKNLIPMLQHMIKEIINNIDYLKYEEEIKNEHN